MVIMYFHVTYPFFLLFHFHPTPNLSETIKKINQYLCNIYYEVRTMLGKVIYYTEPALKRYPVIETREHNRSSKKNQQGLEQMSW